MKKKLNCILLIDDEEPDNFFHERIIDRVDCAEKVVAVENGVEALGYLMTKINGDYPHPDLIFLDINMPIMNGWEFLVEYEKLELVQQGEVILVMLTTSLNPDDKEKATTKGIVHSFINKPLTEENLLDILHQYFKDNF